MSILKEIILQLFFALTPFVVFNIYYRDKLRNYSRRFILVTSSACLLLSMTFASSAIGGLIFDIRYVIMFFGLVFGGLSTGFILLAEFVVYRLYLGGVGLWVAMMILACTFSLALALVALYRKTSRRPLIIFWAGVVFSIVPLVMTYLLLPRLVLDHLAFHVIVIPAQNSIGIWLLMSLFNKAVWDKEMFIKHAHHDKVETMSHVAASLAHEVRNPLTAVKGFLKLIKENPDNRPKLEQYIRICLEEIQRTESTLSEYLSITKPLTAKHEHMNFAEQLHAMKDVMSPYANMHKVELEVHAPHPHAAILANPDEIKQVLVNFIKNAVEACAESPNGKVCLALQADEKTVKLLIKDNGIGMSGEQLNRLGSIYFSTKSTGTGLGLTYSYQVIRAMGGTITVVSKYRSGTTFTITLPADSPS